jgi:hypothetical protein
MESQSKQVFIFVSEKADFKPNKSEEIKKKNLSLLRDNIE